MSFILEAIQSHLSTIEQVKSHESTIQKIVDHSIAVLKKGGKIIVMGNGGSAADAQHIAGELVGRFKLERKALAAVAITTDTSILTSLGNDYAFDDIFSRQVEALARPGDIVLGLSTSGSSKNVYNAFVAARSMGCETIALLGKDGGTVKGISDIPLIISSKDTPRIQECHMLIAHIICELVEKGCSENPVKPGIAEKKNAIYPHK